MSDFTEVKVPVKLVKIIQEITEQFWNSVEENVNSLPDSPDIFYDSLSISSSCVYTILMQYALSLPENRLSIMMAKFLHKLCDELQIID